jgi:hypothetical protein
MSSPTQEAINLLIWTIIFTLLDVLFVCLRFLAARLSYRKLYTDDYLIVFAMVSVLVTFANNI